MNVIDRNTYEKLRGAKLEKTKVKAFAYSAKTPVKFLGRFTGTIETRKRVAVAVFYVAETPHGGNLISSTTAQDLGLISIHVKKVSASSDTKIEDILCKYDTVFRGLGKLKDTPVKLNIDQEKPPKSQPHAATCTISCSREGSRSLERT